MSELTVYLKVDNKKKIRLPVKKHILFSLQSEDSTIIADVVAQYRQGGFDVNIGSEHFDSNEDGFVEDF